MLTNITNIKSNARVTENYALITSTSISISSVSIFTFTSVWTNSVYTCRISVAFVIHIV